MAIRYACLECGSTLVNAPNHYARDDDGDRIEVMTCPTCDRFYRRDREGNMVETEVDPNP